jgi:small subunit ribosomal protein S16
MLMIRLQRVGRVHEPTFRLVLTDSKNSPKSGKYLEVLGSYDPRRENKLEQFDTDKIKYWISKGAKLSDTVHNYLVSKKLIAGKKINALPKKRPIVKEKTEEEKKAEAAKAEVKVEEVAPAPQA